MDAIVEEIIQLVDKCRALEAEDGVYCPDHEWQFDYDETDTINIWFKGWPAGWIEMSGSCEMVRRGACNIEEFRDALRHIVAMTEEARALMAGQLMLWQPADAPDSAGGEG